MFEDISVDNRIDKIYDLFSRGPSKIKPIVEDLMEIEKMYQASPKKILQKAQELVSIRNKPAD